MKIDLSAHEARVIGCLIEKQITTPEQYPLSLNALTNACNQKSNREPILELAEAEVQALVDALSRKHLVLERSGFGSRVPKYQQRFCNTEFSLFQCAAQERAIVCELLLRGPQTPGELRSRGARMASFADVTEVEAALEALAQRDGGPMVMRLAREPGRREARYAHLFGGQTPAAPVAASPPPREPPPREPVAMEPAATAKASSPAPLDLAALDRLALLERQVRQLLDDVERLKRGGA